MDARTIFNKALLLLDRGRTGEAEAALREALAAAEALGQEYDEIQILCCLGEFLHEHGRNVEAMELLQRVIDSDYAESLPEEQERARRLLQRILEGVK